MPTMFDDLRAHLTGVPAGVAAAILDRTTIPSNKVPALAAACPNLGHVAGFADMNGWSRHHRRVGRAALMAAVTTDTDVIALAANDSRVQVVAAAATNPMCSAGKLEVMWYRNFTDRTTLLRHVAAHPNASPVVLDQAVAHRSALVRAAAAGNPSLNGAQVGRLRSDVSELVRSAIVGNTALPTAALASCPASNAAAFARVMADAFGDHPQAWVAACRFAEHGTLTCGEVVEAVRLTIGPRP